MSPHLSLKSPSALASTSSVTGTISATRAVASSTHNGKANDGQAVTATNVTGPAASIMMDRSMQPRLPSSFKRVDGGS